MIASIWIHFLIWLPFAPVFFFMAHATKKDGDDSKSDKIVVAIINVVAVLASFVALASFVVIVIWHIISGSWFFALVATAPLAFVIWYIASGRFYARASALLKKTLDAV